MNERMNDHPPHRLKNQRITYRVPKYIYQNEKAK